MDFSTRETTSKKVWKQRRFFDDGNYIEKIKWKNRGYFDQQIYVKKGTWRQSGFFEQQNYTKKSTWKKHEFFDHQITPQKVCGNNVDFFTIDHFSISKNTFKKYVEMTWKFVKIWSLTFQLNINVVCPLRFLSIPRLELTAAVLPVKMAYLIRKELNLGTVAEVLDR